VTARSLEAMIRLSQAHAKLHMADSVEAVDVAVASRILDTCYTQVTQQKLLLFATASASGGAWRTWQNLDCACMLATSSSVLQNACMCSETHSVDWAAYVVRIKR
jgi:hypothetical protein